MSVAIRQQIAMLTAQASRMEAEEKAQAAAEIVRAAVRAARQAEEAAQAARQAEEAEAARQAEEAEAAHQAGGGLIRLKLESGDSIWPSSGNHKAALRCSFGEGQSLKIVPITTGPHAGYVEIEAVGGRFYGKPKKYVLDNYEGKSKWLCFYKRCLKDNDNQRWKITDGKISSANGGRQIKAGQHGTFTFAEEGEEGDTFILSYE